MQPTITREDLLTAYAAGATSPGLSLLCAAHLTLSPESRRVVAAAEEIGGALLTREPSEAVAPVNLETMMARLDQAESAPGESAPVNAPPAPVDSGGLPWPIARAVGVHFGDISWRRRLPGLSDYVLKGFEGEKVSLIRGRPGARIPEHTHVGVEATLVLSGALRDEEAVYKTGDIALCGPEHEHHPTVDGEEICYCLAVVDGSLRFTGTWGPALNLFAN